MRGGDCGSVVKVHELNVMLVVASENKLKKYVSH
jgi:hypothetical protein